VLHEPLLINRLGSGVVIDPIEDHHLALELGLFKDVEQVLLRATGLGEDHSFLLKLDALLRLRLRGRGKAPAEGAATARAILFAICTLGLRTLQ
jgi:hypothetical protein